MNIITLLKEKLNKSKDVELSNNDNKLITFLNPYSYLLFRKNLLLFSKLDVIYIDGILLIYLLRLFSIKSYRHSFDMTSLAPLVFNDASKKNKKLYFVGSKQEEIVEFVEKIKEEYPKLNIIGFRNGYFDELTKKESIQKIILLQPDIVISGMGTPFQEEFLIDLRKEGWDGTGYTCGGFLHQTAKNIEYYPKIFDTLNLRWLYRIYDEPKLLRRYVVLYPKSILIYIFDAITYKLNKKK
jgi:N-acetylglucosaminyldiphosphoundecaprenol N-acetyl-beta-D-mannosaminyltransferase